MALRKSRLNQCEDCLFTLNRRNRCPNGVAHRFFTFIEIDRSYRPKASTEMSKGKKKFDPHASAISQRG